MSIGHLNNKIPFPGIDVIHPPGDMDNTSLHGLLINNDMDLATKILLKTLEAYCAQENSIGR